MPNEKVKILICDDHEENMDAIAKTLDELGLDIIKALSAKEVIRHCLNNDFALILLDVKMPVMNGFETAALLRQNQRFLNTPMIFLTAYARSEAEMFKGYSLGAVDYILTPYDPNVLKAKVQRFVELFRSTQLLKQQAETLVSANEELRQSFAETKTLKNHLELANKQLDAFSYSVSHDLQAPLRTVNGFSQKLLEEYGDKLEGDAKDSLERIHAGAQRMKELTDDLLAFSRITRAEVKRSKFDLSALVSAIIDDLKSKEPERQVEFVSQSNLIVNGDEHLLRAVMENLLGNSWKFTAKRPKAAIEFGYTKGKGKDKAVYFVRDNGAGFDMKYAGKLFTPFQRLHSTEEFPGTGIGLSIVQHIISRHGGRVWSEGVVEQGATFYFTLG